MPPIVNDRVAWSVGLSDNADITQSQARYTRHRRMQELVNSFCTDSWLLRANTVLCHSTQYSLLVYLSIQLYTYSCKCVSINLLSYLLIVEPPWSNDTMPRNNRNHVVHQQSITDVQRTAIFSPMLYCRSPWKLSWWRISLKWFNRSAWNLAQWLTLSVRTVSAVRPRHNIASSCEKSARAIRPFVKILWPLVIILFKEAKDFWIVTFEVVCRQNLEERCWAA